MSIKCLLLWPAFIFSKNMVKRLMEIIICCNILTLNLKLQLRRQFHEVGNNETYDLGVRRMLFFCVHFCRLGMQKYVLKLPYLNMHAHEII